MSRSVKVEIRTITGLRGIAALSIVLFHFKTNDYVSGLDYGVAENLTPLLGSAVDLFFIISGFVMFYAYRESVTSYLHKDYVKFIILRLARLYPIHLATILAFLLMWAVEKTVFGFERQLDFLSFSSVISNLLMIQDWPLVDARSINYVSWSVSLEWLAYLLFPLFVMTIGRFTKPGAIWGLMALLTLLSIGMYDLRPVRLLCGFGIGCCLFLLWQPKFSTLYQESARPRKLGWITPLPLVALLIFLALLVGDGLAPFFTGIYTVLMYATLFFRDRFSDFLSSRAMVYLGTISYSIYMLHPVIQVALNQASRRVPEFSPSPWLAWPLSVLMVVLVSTLSFTILEEPIRRWVKKWALVRFG